MQTLLRGSFAGFVATGPMTLALFAMHERLPRTRRSPLPPATLTYDLVNAVSDGTVARTPVPKDVQSAATMVSHFSYGAATGMIYAATAARAPLPPMLKGIAFGLAVWTFSYVGWIPLTGFRAAAPRMPASRNAVMVIAHVVWGACLGYAEASLRRAGDEMLVGERKAPRAE